MRKYFMFKNFIRNIIELILIKIVVMNVLLFRNIILVVNVIISIKMK